MIVGYDHNDPDSRAQTPKPLFFDRVKDLHSDLRDDRARRVRDAMTASRAGDECQGADQHGGWRREDGEHEQVLEQAFDHERPPLKVRLRTETSQEASQPSGLPHLPPSLDRCVRMSALEGFNEDQDDDRRRVCRGCDNARDAGEGPSRHDGAVRLGEADHAERCGPEDHLDQPSLLWIYVDVKGNDRHVEHWRVETGSLARMVKRGLKKTDFPVGTDVIVGAFGARDEQLKAAGM